MPRTPFMGVRISWLIIGQEFRLGPVGKNRLLLGLLEFRLALLQFGDVRARADQVHTSIAADQTALAGDQVAGRAVTMGEGFFELAHATGLDDLAVAFGESSRLPRRRSPRPVCQFALFRRDARNVAPRLVDGIRTAVQRPWT